jgi:cyclopropane fatty-acyl-phospholipid synthase-like methyltransferase
VPWKGDEAVRDVGCGHGLMLVGAARRLTTGKATGIDIWQAEDLTGNRPAVRERLDPAVGLSLHGYRRMLRPRSRSGQ